MQQHLNQLVRANDVEAVERAVEALRPGLLHLSASAAALATAAGAGKVGVTACCWVRGDSSHTVHHAMPICSPLPCQPHLCSIMSHARSASHPDFDHRAAHKQAVESAVAALRSKVGRLITRLPFACCSVRSSCWPSARMALLWRHCNHACRWLAGEK